MIIIQRSQRSGIADRVTNAASRFGARRLGDPEHAAYDHDAPPPSAAATTTGRIRPSVIHTRGACSGFHRDDRWTVGRGIAAADLLFARRTHIGPPTSNRCRWQRVVSVSVSGERRTCL